MHVLTHRVAFIIAVLLVSAADASVWHPVDNKDLTIALAYGMELANSESAPSSYPYIRLYAVPEVVGECWGTLESCPDWRLYISISMGDLYEEPFVFQFPNSKGWKFLGWQQSDEPQTVRFRITTTLPGANLEAEVRDSWEPDVYEVLIGPNGPRLSLIPDESE